ncbi:MAG TPA: Gfo/Idh/MocA family oxidoreductase [Candidatus Paceibacterota bacterium]|nr:Gfo/Idh/MocA family oxidoreductase [Verrucomicrobiota bacterium]HRY46665.1 Gfo/Idh/MocA family oxidoreductase [Candidatus Paceibacterota bacterium]HRZ99806.1 Gfo/Idh/MocA family oxidoreductase [Candidatus Paceibacterota bacterium]
MKTKRMTRRNFARTLLSATGGVVIAPALLRGQNLTGKLNIAIIACGGRGAGNMDAVASENIVALCDVNAANLEAAGVKHRGARKVNDFRKLFDKPGDFDAVVVSTCEHTHAFATLLALEHRKHVYCEKPLTHNIREARRIREAAAEARVATQMGIQIHATENYRQVVEWIRAGAVGPIREVHVWVSRAWGWQSEQDAKRHKDIVWVVERPREAQPVPVGLDWDLWLGPAPERPFHSVYFPGPKWYRWWDFGNGTMSDLGSHWIDLPFWALDLEAPITVEASGPPPHPEIAPASMTAVYEYGARGEKPPVKVSWYQGEDKPQIWTERGIPQWDSGCLFIGSKGMILADYGKHVLLPEKDFAGIQRPAPSIRRSPGHHAEWIEACKGGPAASADFRYSGWLTEANHLGNVAYRCGMKLTWDAKAMKAVNAPQADRYISRAYREGWKL